MDKLFRIKTLAATANPQQLIWQAMHQDYSDRPTCEDTPPAESIAGALVVRHLLSANRGHYGPLEHPQITVNVCAFPHSTMQQLRTHRVGISFDVSSFRYTSERIVQVGHGTLDPDAVFYLRPVGYYTNRQGKKYHYTEVERRGDLKRCMAAADEYARKFSRGMSEEQARGTVPFDIRQHFVMSCNVRSLMHLLDLRWKKDAQLEAQQFSKLLFDRFEEWCPELAAWYQENRAQRARLAP
jgi:thymidylate synthase (FAD)